ncbi:autophagy protein Atg13, putative [Paecilomyces variotii No. 5]|uniref:Autophagy-related protein 13 n=1 Tax=Byssochlamys spectabilis (strain No. 5 / NBRC 109023) TaxID=1356009 RepID=V5FF08_BYSSN|nr:autophagy protein Atg13, putative [Paecilomyces variotii No. 5]
MHQHPRTPPVTASPANSARPGTGRSNLSRESEAGSSSPQSGEVGTNNPRGLGIETETESSEQAQRNPAPAKEAMAKLNQIISNYHTKAALIILHARVDLPRVYNKGSDTPRVNRWFNVELDETDVLREHLRTWRSCDANENRPPPMIIETYLDGGELTNNQSLVIIDDNGKRWDVLEALAASRGAPSARLTKSSQNEVILERWRVELGAASGRPPADLGSILPTVYKKSIVLFRSLFTYSKFLPAWKFTKRNGKMRASPALRMKYRILQGTPNQDTSKLDNLTTPLYEGGGKVVDTYSFGSTDSPAGPFTVQVTYRTSCDFRVDDSEALLSSRFMGADDEFFRPSLPSEGLHRPSAQNEVGSLPSGRKMTEQPDPTRAYGSLSTFHQVGPPSASPISTLRAARELGTTSPSPSSPTNRLLPAAKIGPAGRAAVLAGEGGSGVVRRPSVSFQPFKAPPLSASPSLVDPPISATGRTPPTGSSDSKNMPPPSTTGPFTRKPMAIPSENAIASSNSASPKPAPISRYSSSFSHRRGRLSSGGTTRTEDDTSSGKASATSSAAQPGSGLLADPTGTSADSIHADDEKISEFLKLLDMRKDLLTPANTAAADANTRKTSAALTRFQRMRDSNAALSDSMSSSLLMQRSSTSSSRQLSSVPPMVAGTSISTASSPGKPISPHTPHTPAIPSRLSSNSIVEYGERDVDRRSQLSHEERSSPLEENTSDEPTPSGVSAIDIPTSPRPFPQPYRRSSSAAQDRRSHVDDDEIFPFGMRSVSLGNGDPSHLSLSTRLRQQEFDNVPQSVDQQQAHEHSSPTNDDTATPSSTAASDSHRGSLSQRGGFTSNPYQPRFPRGQGSSGGPQSHSSTSSSLARASAIPPHLSDRDRGRGDSSSGSSSAHSTTDIRRGTGQRSTSGRSYTHTAPFEEDEPLLFAMSDFQSSRRSLEEGRNGSSAGDSTGNTTGSRPNSGRRGPGLSGFHAWQ